MHCNKVSFQKLLDCFDNDLGNNLENNADNLEHIAEKLQEILNRIMQRIMSIITSALIYIYVIVRHGYHGVYEIYYKPSTKNNKNCGLKVMSKLVVIKF